MSASNLGYDVVSILAKRDVSIAALLAALLWLLGVLDGLYQLTLRLRTELLDAGRAILWEDDFYFRKSSKYLVMCSWRCRRS